MAKREWTKIGVEATISIFFAGFALDLLLLSPPANITETNKFLIVLFLYITWVFLHFTYLQTVRHSLRPSEHKLSLTEQDLENYLANGFTFVAMLGDNQCIVEGQSKKISL